MIAPNVSPNFLGVLISNVSQILGHCILIILELLEHPARNAPQFLEHSTPENT
jgi:hypothetical protein